MKANFVTALVISGSLSALTAVARPCKTSSDLWPYEFKKENKNSEILLYADLYLERSCESVMAEAKVGSIGQLYGISADLVEAKATATLENRREVIVAGDVTVLGYVVGDFQRRESTTVSIGDTMTYPIALSDSQRFMVGPVPVDVDYGLVGEGGLRYNAELSVGAIDLDATPFVSSQVFASAGLKSPLVDVLASGEITLINDTLQNQISLAIDQVDLNTVYFDASGVNYLDALDGKISVKAQSKVAGFNRTYNKDLVNWKGISREDQAFRVELDYPISF